MQRQTRGLMSPYVGFLIDKLNKIYDAWDRGEEELALRRAVMLRYFLVKELKDALKEDAEQITLEMNEAYEKEGASFLAEEAVRSRRTRAVAKKWLPVFVDKLTTLFDEKDYFEIHKRLIPTNIPPELFGQSAQ